MATEGPKPPPTDDLSTTADSFLQEVARVPRRVPSGMPDPVQIAHFRIERRLGEGGMGVVYRAMDEKLQRYVALKVLPSGFESDAEHLHRFVREARSAAAITHPNIATIYEVGEANEHVFIAMELVEGQTLRARILDELSLDESVRIARDIARGLGRAHEKGIVHRDLKPENVMISHRGEVKILDFGLAKLLETEPSQPALPSPLANTETDVHVTVDGRVVGTPAYMSPEQAKGEVVDVRTDIFSFGVLFYEMLAGSRPFHGATSIAVMMSAGRDTPKRVSEINPAVPANLDAIVARCIEKEKRARYADGDALLAALDVPIPRAIGTDSEGARSARGSDAGMNSVDTQPLEVKPTEVKRSRLWMAGLVFLAGLLVLAPVLVWGERGRSTSEPPHAAVAEPPPQSRAPIGLLDHPPPKTKSPEALTEYRRAMTDWRDAVRPRQTSFERAVELDPEFAAAHLRLAMVKLPPASTRAYREAQRFRDNLDARDQELLQAEEPMAAGVPIDLVEAEKRYAALHEANPEDIEILMRLATIRGSRDPGLARETFQKVIDLDPKMAGAALAAGDNEKDADDLDKASEHYRRCLEVSPTATRCLSRLARLQAVSGRCDAYLQDVTRILVLEPDDWFFRRDGLSAALTSGAAEDAVHAAVDGVLRTKAASLKLFYKEQLEGNVALWRGSFVAARAAFARADSLAPDVGLSKALPVTAPERLTIAEELGSDDEVSAIARAYVGARSLTTPEDEVDGVVLASLRRHHVFPDDEILRIRDRWKKEATRESSSIVWLHYEAGLALTEDEAKAALASAPKGKISHDRMDVNAKLGRVLLLAHEWKDAASRLELVANNCALFQGDDSYVRLIVPAACELGLAYEGLGNTDGACGAYKRVIALWGNAAPRSVSADTARARFRALHCAN